MRIMEIGDAIAELLEPWDTGTAPATLDGRRFAIANSGVVVDLNMTRPELFEAERLYLWPTSHQHTLAGAGSPPEEICRWAWTALYVADRQDEEAQVSMRRDVSDAMDEKAHDYAAAIASHRSRLADGSPAPWGHIETSIDHGANRTFGVRGIAATITGYRIAQYA
jgi:hypothetical protein